MSYIKREPLLQIAKKLQGSAFGGPLIVRAIEEAPAEDVVEVVRCKDCKHYKEWEDGDITCSFWTVDWDVTTKPNAFCSCGERRTSNDG